MKEKQMSEKKSASQELKDMMGFDATKQENISNELFAEVLDELKEKRTQEAKEKARGLLKKAVELQNKLDQLERDFRGQTQKFEKELGKILNSIKGDLHCGNNSPILESPQRNKN